MRNKKIIFCLFFICLFLTSCTDVNMEKSDFNTDDTAYDTVNVKKDPDLNLAMIYEKNLNPLLVKNSENDHVMKLIYDGLFKIDENYNAIPALAKSITYSDGGMKVLLTLKDDIKWHDYRNIVSQDVTYTLNFIRNHPESPYYSMISNIASWEITDNKRISLKLNSPSKTQEFCLIFPIIPNHSGESEFVLNGNGRYMYEKNINTYTIRLKKFDAYYGSKPKINNIKIHLVSGKQEIENLFLSTDSDIADVGYQEISRYKYPIFEIIPYESRQYEMLIFNTQRPPFNMHNNRKAVICAIDRQMIINKAYHLEKSLNEIFLHDKSDLSFNKNIFAYAPEKTDKLWKTQKRKTYYLAVSKDEPLRYGAAVLISEQLKSVAIDTEVIGLETNELKQKLHLGNYDMALIGYRTSLSPDIMKFFKGKNLVHFNSMNLKQKEQFAASGFEFKTEYAKLQKSFVQSAFYAGFCFTDRYAVLNSRISGKLKPNEYNIYNGIENLSIK